MKGYTYSMSYSNWCFVGPHWPVRQKAHFFNVIQTCCCHYSFPINRHVLIKNITSLHWSTHFTNLQMSDLNRRCYYFNDTEILIKCECFWGFFQFFSLLMCKSTAQCWSVFGKYADMWWWQGSLDSGCRFLTMLLCFLTAYEVVVWEYLFQTWFKHTWLTRSHHLCKKWAAFSYAACPAGWFSQNFPFNYLFYSEIELCLGSNFHLPQCLSVYVCLVFIYLRRQK